MEKYRAIFLVDDDEDDRLLLSEALADAIDSVKIIQVENPESLFVRLDSEPSTGKLILMDMNMPRRNGLEMLGAIKRDHRYKHIPVVMISTTTTPSLVSKAYDMGANAFIVKPVTASEYERVAHGVGLCFLNIYRNFVSQPITQLSIQKTIVIIEDCDDHWRLFEIAFKNSPMKLNVVRIQTREEAVDFVETELARYKPAVYMILIDLYLPGRDDGLGLLSDIRHALAVHHLEKIPIVVFTYSDDANDIDDCYRKRANAYIIKPFDVTGWQFTSKTYSVFGQIP